MIYHFPIIILEVVNSTKDEELHDILSEVMAARIDELIRLEDMAPPEVISDFTHSVLRTLTAATKSLEQAHVKKVTDLESQLREAKEQVQYEKTGRKRQRAQMNKLKNNIRHFRELLSRTSACWNCNTKFDCYMSDGSYPNPYVLRCKKCGYKHH